jgi:hypothetical protein
MNTFSTIYQRFPNHTGKLLDDLVPWPEPRLLHLFATHNNISMCVCVFVLCACVFRETFRDRVVSRSDPVLFFESSNWRGRKNICGSQTPLHRLFPESGWPRLSSVFTSPGKPSQIADDSSAIQGGLAQDRTPWPHSIYQHRCSAMHACVHGCVLALVMPHVCAYRTVCILAAPCFLGMSRCSPCFSIRPSVLPGAPRRRISERGPRRELRGHPL